MTVLFTWREFVLLIAFSVVVFLAGMLIGMLRRIPHRSGGTEQAVALTTLREEMEDLRRRVNELDAARPPLSEPPSTQGDPLYASAANLLGEGLHSNEVAARLGLSRAEVDLIAILHHRESARGDT